MPARSSGFGRRRGAHGAPRLSAMPFLPQPGAPLLTSRLELRALSGTDLGQIHAIHADPRTFAHDSTPPVTSREAMESVLATWIAEWEAQGFGYCAVRPRKRHPVDPDANLRDPDTILRDPALVLGVCGLTRYRLGDRVVLSAYYRFRPECWGLGTAREALTAVLDQAARAFPGAESAVITDGGNTPSLALAARLGYRRTAEAIPGEPDLVILTRTLGSAPEAQASPPPEAQLGPAPEAQR